MAVFPARLSADGAAVELSWGAEGAGAAVASAPTQGGADSSIERNNVYGLEPRVYLEDGREVSEETGRVKAKPAELSACAAAARRPMPPAAAAPRRGGHSRTRPRTPCRAVLATVAVAIVAVAGTAIAIAKESIPGLIVFWVALLTPVGLYVFKAPEEGDASGPPA